MLCFRTCGLTILSVYASLVLAGPAQSATSAGKSGLLPLGAEAPGFQLTDVVSGKVVSREEFAGKRGLLVMFICRHCPYVKHVLNGLVQLGKDYAGKDLAIVAISANDPVKAPVDAPEGLKAMVQQEGFGFPLLFDETQTVAKTYTAACTPDFFLFDQARHLVYRGQFDDSRPGNDVPVTGQDLRAAIDALLAGQPVPAIQKPSFGCGIIWKPGRTPTYLQ